MQAGGGGAGFGAARTFAKDFFAALAGDLPLQGEVIAAMDECMRRYDTGPYENRFGVGGTFEQILGATARALGFHVENAGAHRQRYDLELSPGYGLSVKAAFGSYTRSTRIRITNSQGATGVWDTGTLFVYTDMGIGYADALLAPGITKQSGDQKSLDVAFLPLLHLWGVQPRQQRGSAPGWLTAMPLPPHLPGYFISMPVPNRLPQPSPRLISDPIALDLLSSGRSPRLLRNFKWSV